MHYCGQPFRLAPAKKPERQSPCRGISGRARRSAGRLDLRERQPRVVEKRPTCGRQFDPTRAAYQELDADLRFEVADLPAQRGLCGVQPPIGCERKTPLLGDCHEIAQMPQFHSFRAMPVKYDLHLTKSFLESPRKPKSSAPASFLEMPAPGR